jgi:hypothetical protein
MRRVLASSVVASAFALLAVLASVADALALGGPPGGFVVPPGSTASFTNITFGACNSLTWGFQLNGGPNMAQFTFGGGCGSATARSMTIGPFATPTTLRVFLTDNHCGFTYYSDGTPVDHVIVSGSDPFSLRFADSGGFCERTTTTTNTFLGCNFCVTLTISDQAITPAGQNVRATEGGLVSGTVATFTDADPTATAADYTAVIDWGDGSSSSGAITGSSTFSVSGAHTYAEEGAYAISVTITDADNPANSATVTSTATVTDAALTASPACAATELGSYNGKTAAFTDAAGSFGAASDFGTTIDWGDGTTTAGAVGALGSGAYSVSGSHHYSSTGIFTIKTTVTDDGGSVAMTSCTTVGFAFAPGGGAFVIGSGHSGVGQSVTFWSAQWAAINLGSRAAGARSFKGFADAPAAPSCGSVWSGDTGNATPPPAGSLPEFMGVIVTDSASQSGADVSGGAVHVVVVKTDPGYSPNAGHSGTGTVVAVVC